LSRFGRTAPLACLALCAAAAAAVADDSTEPPPASGWSFSVSPYVWGSSLNGTTAVGSRLPPIEIDASFKDILRNLNIAAMVLGEVRYQRFGAYADVVYTNIEADAGGSSNILFDDIDVHNQLFIGTFGGEYRVLEGQMGSVDLLAGARVWSVNTRLDINGGLLDDREFEDSESWVDPVIGVKGRFDFGEGLFAVGMGHVGGFGVGSDLTWDVFGGLGYDFNDNYSVLAGYRHLAVDYANEDFKFDVELSGPVIGGTIRF
jgi:hypothetical protein